jgi:beta-galactosidase
MKHCKIGSSWREITAAYKKENGQWVVLSDSELEAYFAGNIAFYDHHESSMVIHTLMIGGSSVANGENCNYTAIYDGSVVSGGGVAWSIVSGSLFTTISQSGELSILPGASEEPVIIQIVYNGLVATKSVVATYDTGSTSETETSTEVETNDSGQTITTTTTTTTTTDESGNTIVSETITQIIENEDGSLSSIEQETVENSDGTITSSSTTINYNDAGEVTGSQTAESIENPDGSNANSITNYDENGMPTDTTNQSGDTVGNVDTQRVEYDESGTPVVTGYEIDTTGSNGEGKEIEGNGIDTEFVPFKFASEGFVINFDFESTAAAQPRPPLTEDTEDTGTNYLYTILGAKTTAKVGSIWPGFEIRWTIPKGGTPDFSDETKCTLQVGRTLVGETQTTRTNFTSNYCVNGVYHLTIIYNPYENTKFIVRSNVSNSNITSANKSLQDNVDLDLTIGYSIDHNGNQIRHSSLVVHDFSVVKLNTAATITQPIISCTNNEVTMSCATPGAKIYYKVDNESKYDLYKSPIEISANTTFNAYAIFQNKISSVVTQSCSYDDGVPHTPTIACDGIYVTITCETQGANIYYKLGENGEFTQYSSPIEINEDVVVYAYSQNNGLSSAVVSENCAVLVVADPVISYDGQYATITCQTQGATIHYKLNQDVNYSAYTSPIQISADTTVYAYATVGPKSSTTVSALCEYSIEVSAPVISCEFNEVTITCDTVGADIYYRFDTGESYSAYSGSFEISAMTFVQAFAVLNNVSSSTVYEVCTYEEVHDYSQDYLTFNIITTGDIKWKALGSGYAKTIEYSINGGTWTSITSTSAGVSIPVTAGDRIRFRGTNTTYAGSKSNYSGFEGGSAYFDIEGNINSLLYGDNFASTTALTNSTYQFCSIFKLTNAVSAENLILPATTLKNYCYRAMFSNTYTLEKAPALPATTLAKGVYWYMFENCAIIKAPDLLATTLTGECYGYMFTGCHNLNYIRCLATTSLGASSALTGWVTNVAATGTFIKDEGTVWSRGNSGIPNGWTIVDEGAITVDAPTVSYDLSDITLACETSGADIYYKLNQDSSYSLYDSPIAISANTIVVAYAVLQNVSSLTTTQYCEYVSVIPFEESNRTLGTWVYNNNEIQTPYSVNAIDGHSSNYSKGNFNFETTFALREAQPTYLWFQHADQSADIYVDGTMVETHWGGYNAFFSDISNYVHSGTNSVRVTLCNATRNTLAPSAGDFNYNATLGNVKLFTSPVLPDMYYGYDGFHVTSDVATSSATISVKTLIPSGAVVCCTISGDSCNFSQSANSTSQEMVFTTTIQNPHLWNGTVDPYLYNITLEIYHDGYLYHKYERGYGLRFFDYAYSGTTASGETGYTYNGQPYTGFLLNGQPYFLRGVCMHHDLEGKANALTDSDIANDFEIIQELGCNFVRLAHYPHPKETYDWCDRLGIIVQTEVPCVNIFNTGAPQSYYDHLDIQYADMVKQHFNHPCIVFWGLFNEAGSPGDTTWAAAKLNYYRDLIRDIDPSRWVGYVVPQGQSNPSSYMGNPDMDWFGCNIYVGWYTNNGQNNGTLSNDPTSALNTRVNNIIKNRHKPLAYSEYGCGGNIYCHSESADTTTDRGNKPRHDIEYMMWLHEGHLAAIRNFPQLLFTGEWQLFDIAVSSRAEGYKVCLDGETVTDDNSFKYLNDKGLVMRDHTTKKDPFYLYKAEWNPTPFVHICGQNYTRKIDRVIKCYSNDGTSFSLYVNNELKETVTATNHIVEFTARTFNTGDVVRVDGANTSDTFTF